MRLLFVCLGNICRSPAAEAIFLHKIHHRGIADKYFVDSAGTGGWHVGRPADSRMRAAAKRRGIVISSIARQIDLQDFENFDLILTMDSDNFKDVSRLAKQTKVNIKPMLSYAKSDGIVDVPDPYYGGESGFEDVLNLLDEACEGLIEDLGC